ncbi:MAG TPA: protein kinase [Candidatus Limiplasma merdipullorum]|nr:protein kinase [Candidatus Limiplasma merdipullorum]
MSGLIGGYRPLTPLRTVGSGSARWCIAARGLEKYFLKQFLSPVYPADPSTPLGQRQRERCEAFEGQKQRLYAALSCVIGDTLVPVLDFFRFERRYYAASEAVFPSDLTADDAAALDERAKRQVLSDLALCLQRLHTQGVVHADLKPDHVLLLKRPTGYRIRLIDLDSGFLKDDPPQNQRDLEGDPVYLSPEAFLYMAGQDAPLGPKLDTFAFGALIHRVWTGDLPGFDHAKYTYLYEAALDGGDIALSPTLPVKLRDAVLHMLDPKPDNRPEDAEVTNLLSISPEDARPPQDARPLNGLSRFMKPAP